MNTTNFLSGMAGARARLAMLGATLVASTIGFSAPAEAQTTPTITFGTAPAAQYPGADFSVSATTDSDGALTYSWVSGPCALVNANAGTFRPNGYGDCVVQASTAVTVNFSAGSAQQTVTIGPANLWAVTSASGISLPGGGPAVTVWGYNSTNTPATKPGGPVLVVNQGDTVSITLNNALAESTALLVLGLDMIPDTTGVASGGSKTYTFLASRPGTYLYEAGLLPNTEHQVAMGLYGALIVRPTSAPGQAYGDPSTAFNDEAVLVLSEIDPTLNNLVSNPSGCTAATPQGCFDMRNYAPKYFLINGTAYPDTAPIASIAGNKVLLRYVNAGARHHSMAVLGLRQNFVGKDASPLPTGNVAMVAETLAPGQTADAIATIPNVTTASRFAVYDGSMMLHNNGAAGFGGMLTFVTAGSGSGTTGPATSAVALQPNPSNGSAPVTLTATIATGATAAEYFVDSVGANGTGCSITGSLTSVSVSIPVSGGTPPCVDLTTLPAGNHAFYVHATDGTSWGAVASAVLSLDKTGPTSTGLTLTPNPSNGSVTVALSGTANDSATGNSNVTAARYSIDGGAAVAMTLGGVPAPVRSITATIPAGLAVGTHSVAVESQDALGNWGGATTIMLNVVAGGPVTSNVTAAPNPNNGTLPLDSSQPVVRVTATMTSNGSTVTAAEGFIDTPPANVNVRGFPFVPSDGVFNSAIEIGRADVPLSTINALSPGNHTIYVRGKDAAGNWGSTSTTTLVIDKTEPTISSASLSPATIGIGTASVTLNVTAADTGGATVAGGQYWIDGTATPPANPIAFTGTSATINTGALTVGVHTVYVRVRDTAGNWSAVSSTTLTVLPVAVNDAKGITASNQAAQSVNYNAANGLLVNDLPLGVAGRTATLASVPIRTSGTGLGTMTVTCQGGGGNTPGPAIGGNTVCTNGAFQVILTGVGSTGAARAASKRGTFTFTYTETLNGQTSLPATVTITVN